MTTRPVRLNPGGDPATGMVPSAMVDPDDFTTGDRTELISHHYTTDDESIMAGVWECAPCKEEIDAYPVHEMMTVLDGSVTVTDADGHAHTYDGRHVLHSQGHALHLGDHEEAAQVLHDRRRVTARTRPRKGPRKGDCPWKSRKPSSV